MNLHRLRILDFKMSNSKTNTGEKPSSSSFCKANNEIDKKCFECPVVDSHVDEKESKTSSGKKHNFLHRRTSSEIFKNKSLTKLQHKPAKKLSFEDLKKNCNQNKRNEKSPIKLFNRESIMNLHLKGGDMKSCKRRSRKDYDTAVLLNGTSAKRKPSSKEGMIQHPNNVLQGEMFEFFKNNRPNASCYRQSHDFINLDQCIVGLRNDRKKAADRPIAKRKDTKRYTSPAHFPLKILTSLSNSKIRPQEYDLLKRNVCTTTPRVNCGDRNIRISPQYKAKENNSTSRHQVVAHVKTYSNTNISGGIKTSRKATKENKPTNECAFYSKWKRERKLPLKSYKDVFVKVSTSALKPRVQNGCDATVATNKSHIAYQSPYHTEQMRCQPVIDRQTVETSSSLKIKKLENERPRQLTKSRNILVTDRISNLHVGQTKHKFPVQCMRYVVLGLLVVVSSPCLLALFLGWLIMRPLRTSPPTDSQQVLDKKKRSENDFNGTNSSIRTIVNNDKCLNADNREAKPRVPTNPCSNKSNVSVYQRVEVPLICFANNIENKNIPNKAKRKCAFRHKRNQGSSNIIMDEKNHREKNIMSSFASWCKRTVASFGNALSAVKRQLTGGRSTPSLSPTTRCHIQRGKGIGWTVKPQVLQNVECKNSPHMYLSSSNKDGTLKPKYIPTIADLGECVKASMDCRNLYDKKYSSSNQQVNIQPMKLERFEYPDTINMSCRHRRIRNLSVPRSHPKHGVDPWQGSIFLYPYTSALYYPEQLLTQNINTLNYKNRSRTESIGCKRHQHYNDKAKNKHQKVSPSRNYKTNKAHTAPQQTHTHHSTCAKNSKTCRTLQSHLGPLKPSFPSEAKRTIQRQRLISKKETDNNQYKKRVFNKESYHPPQEHSIQRFHEDLRKWKQGVSLKNVNNYLHQQYNLPSPANKIRQYKQKVQSKVSRAHTNLEKRVKTGEVDSKLKSHKALYHNYPEQILSSNSKNNKERKKAAVRLKKDKTSEAIKPRIPRKSVSILQHKVTHESNVPIIIYNAKAFRITRNPLKYDCMHNVSCKNPTKITSILCEKAPRFSHKRHNSGLYQKVPKCSREPRYTTSMLPTVKEASTFCNIINERKSVSNIKKAQETKCPSSKRISNTKDKRYLLNKDNKIEPKAKQINSSFFKSNNHVSDTLHEKISKNVFNDRQRMSRLTKSNGQKPDNKILFNKPKKEGNLLLSPNHAPEKSLNDSESIKSFGYQRFLDGLNSPYELKRHGTELININSSQRLTLSVNKKLLNNDSSVYSKLSFEPKTHKLEHTQSLLIAYRNKYPHKSRKSLKKKLSSVTVTHSCCKYSLWSLKLSDCSRTITSIKECGFPRGLFSPRLCDYLLKHKSYSIFRKSTSICTSDSSSMRISKSYSSIIRKFKSYDAYDNRAKQEPVFKQNLQMYPSLKSNSSDHLYRLQYSHLNKITKRVSRFSLTNSMITKDQLKIILRKRLRYLEDFLRNNNIPLGAFRNDCNYRTGDCSCDSEHMWIRSLYDPENCINCIACKTSYLTGQIHLVRQLLCNMQSNSHRPLAKPVIFNPTTRLNTSYYCQTKVLRNLPFCKQKIFPLFTIPRQQKSLEGKYKCCDNTLYRPSPPVGRHQCTEKCLQKLLAFLQSQCLIGDEDIALTSSNYISNENYYKNVDVNRRSPDKCKEIYPKVARKPLTQDKKISAVRSKEKKSPSSIINNFKQISPVIKDKDRKKYSKGKNVKQCGSPERPRKIRNKHVNGSKQAQCKCAKTCIYKDLEKIDKCAYSLQKYSYRQTNTPKQKKKNIKQSKKKIKKKKTKNKKKVNMKKKQRRRTFQCCGDLLRSIRLAEGRAWPFNIDCNHKYIYMLKNRPYLWIYNCWPTLYPHFLDFVKSIKNTFRLFVICLCCPVHICFFCCFEAIIISLSSLITFCCEF